MAIALTPSFYCCFTVSKLDITPFMLLFQVLTAGEMRVGWARPGCLPDQELGSDDQAFVFDGFKVAGFSCAVHTPFVQFLSTAVVQISHKLDFLKRYF